MKDIKEFITESKNPIEDEYPNVKELGNGEYEGLLWGHCFLYNENKYYSPNGWKNIYPMKCKMIINNDETFAHTIDEYQYPEFKKLYD